MNCPNAFKTVPLFSENKALEGAKEGANSGGFIPHSAFRIPHSEIRIPHALP
jgi:hypothetical protein